MTKSDFMDILLSSISKMNDREFNTWSSSLKITETNEKPKINYTSKALDFLYNQYYSEEHDELFSFIVRSELGKYRFYDYQYSRKEGLYVRETITNVCDLLDKGMTLREITSELKLQFDTVCRIRAFFEEEK